jgi:O-antigen/teichoic acid export membrane protein
VNKKKQKKTGTKKLIHNFSFLTAGKLFGDVFTFLLFVVLSRNYGQEGIGQYSFAMAFSGFFVVIADFGLTNLTIKKISRNINSQNEYLGEVLLLRLYLASFAFMLLLSVLYFLSFSDSTKLIIVIIGGYQLLLTLYDILTTAFISRHDSHIVGLIEFSLKTTTALACLTLVYFHYKLSIVILCMPVVTLLHILITLRLINRKYNGRTHPSISNGNLLSTLKEAIPYAIFIFLDRLSLRLDVVFLGLMLGSAAAGIYNVAYRIIFLLMLIAYFVELTLLPLASKLYLDSHHELKVLFNKSLNLIILIGFPFTAGLWLISNDLIKLLYGPEFFESVTILRYLSGLVLLTFVKSIVGVFLTASDKQHRRTNAQWVSAFLNIVGNSVLIPVIGIIGAAITTVLSELVLIILLTKFLTLPIEWSTTLRRITLSILGSATFCIIFSYIEPMPIYVVIPSSIIIYFFILLLFKEIRNNEGFYLFNRAK